MSPAKPVHLALVSLTCLCASRPASATEVAVCTDKGSFTIELYDDAAPLHAANFIRYVEAGFYSGTTFHRVLKGRVVQGGGYDKNLKLRETAEPVPNESRNGLRNARGTLAAARTDDPNSATAQFFINLSDNSEFDATEAAPGYSVFGRVTSGLEVLDEIGKLPTRALAGFPADVPDPVVAISSMAVVDRAALEALPSDTRAEVLQQRISDAAALNDAEATLAWVEQYRTLCAPADSYVLLMEANAAVVEGQTKRAAYVLEDYFAITDNTHPSYSSAQALSRNLAPTQSAVDALYAHCEIPEAPPLPNGSVDSAAAMRNAQDAVHAYMAGSNLYLDCLAAAVDERDATEEQRLSEIDRHNRMVTRMEQLAEQYNEEVRAFKARGQ